MGWNPGENLGQAWDRASSAAQQREDALRAPGATPKEDRWTPDDWGKWLELESKLQQARAAAMFSREEYLLAKVAGVIEKAYTPGPGETITEEAINNVSESIVKVLLIYSRLPVQVLANTDDEKQAMLGQIWKQELRRQTPCKWTVAKDWDIIEKNLIKRSMKPQLDDRKGRDREGGDDSPLDQEGPWVIQDGTIELDVVSIGLEDLDRLIAAKKNEETTVSVLSKEMLLHVDDLNQFESLDQDIRAIVKDRVGEIYGYVDASSSISDNWAERWITDAEQAKLTSYFDADKSKIYSRFTRDVEWSKAPADLRSQRILLESLIPDSDFLGQWLDLIYKEADEVATENIRAANEKLNTLYSSGKRALDMNLA